MQDPDTPPEVEEVETDVGGVVVRLVVAVVADPDSTVDVVVATGSNRAGSLPLPWTITTAITEMAGQVDGDAVVLVPPTCSPILSRCLRQVKMHPPKYLPSWTTCSSWQKSRKRRAR